jgi:hypothetical protein
VLGAFSFEVAVGHGRLQPTPRPQHTGSGRPYIFPVFGMANDAQPNLDASLLTSTRACRRHRQTRRSPRRRRMRHRHRHLGGDSIADAIILGRQRLAFQVSEA